MPQEEGEELKVNPEKGTYGGGSGENAVKM
jgi:hypothetical protein